MAHDLLAAKRAEQLETHDFALGYGAGASAKSTDRTGGAEASEAEADTKQAHNTSGEEGSASVTAVEVDATERTADQAEKKESATNAASVSTVSRRSGDSTAAGIPPTPSPPEEEGEVQRVEQNTTQAAGEAATEEVSGGDRGGDRSTRAGTTKADSTDAEEQSQLSTSQAKKEHTPTPNLLGGSGGVRVKVRQSNLSKILPDSLAQEIGDRAFPLALTKEQHDNDDEETEETKEKGAEEGAGEGEEKEKEERGNGSSRGGVVFAAFHALAAEAVWAGLNGSGRVEIPPLRVWDSRGGDRWGTAAFFAEQIGEREEEAAPGVPQQAKMLMRQAHSTSDDDVGGVGGSCSGEHPLSGSSARHATARAVCMAAVSSRRGFLKQASEEAAKEVCILEEVELVGQLFSICV